MATPSKGPPIESTFMSLEALQMLENSVKRSHDINNTAIREIAATRDAIAGTKDVIAVARDKQNEQELELQKVIRVSSSCKRSRKYDDDDGVDILSTPLVTSRRRRYKIQRSGMNIDSEDWNSEKKVLFPITPVGSSPFVFKN